MSADADLPDLTLVDAARRLRSGTISPVELTRACLERIEERDPGLNAFITVTADAALADARAAEAEIARGGWRGPLHGIPVGIKDLVDVAGVPTTGASGAYERVPDRDAEVTRRLRASGAVLLGKLNLHELAYGASSVVGRFGAVRNPWGRGVTAGGSSSGSAVALAAGMCYAAVGSDTGGSIRQPAAFCGVVGLKPTFGGLSVDGVMPLAASLDHVGPMARTVDDTAALFAAMGGGSPGDPIGEPLASADADADVRGLRVGVARAHFFEGLDPEVAAALEEALAVLRSLGVELREVTIPADIDTTVFRAEAWAAHRERAAARPDLFQPETLRRIRAGAEITPESVAAARHALSALRSGAASHFERVDAIVTPTAVVPAFDVGDPPEIGPDLRARELVSLRNTRPFNALGVPALSLPCGFTARGLPVGLQIAGAPHGERGVLRLARAYERAAGWSGRAPAFATAPA